MTTKRTTVKYDRRIIAVRSDTHSGNEYGLKNPATLLPVLDKDGNRIVDKWKPVTLKPFQRHLWALHEKGRKGIEALAGTDPITFLEIGDLTTGTWILDDVGENNLSDQYFVARATITPWLDMPGVTGMYVAKGTGVHVWRKGSSEQILVHSLSKEYPNKPVKFGEHWTLDIAGVRLDVAHRGPSMGKRQWLRGNELRWYCQNILMDDVADGERPPDVILRGHFHTYTRAVATFQPPNAYYQATGIIMPTLSYLGEWALNATQSKSRLSLGLIALEVINGKLHDVHAFVEDWDLRKLEVVK